MVCLYHGKITYKGKVELLKKALQQIWGPLLKIIMIIN